MSPRSKAGGFWPCALFGAALCLPACGGGQTRGQAFERDRKDDGGAAITAFQRAFDDQLIPPGADFAVGVTAKGLLIGTKLDGSKPWTFRHALEYRPAIAGTVVVGLGGGELFALDGPTGKLLWKRAAGGALRGIGDDGTTTLISLTAVAGVRSTVLAVSHEGQVIRQIEDSEPIGVASGLDGYAFLPWRSHFVSVYDLATGSEKARVRLGPATSRVFTVGGALFFGEEGLTRFDERIRFAARGATSTIDLPARPLPGSPRWMDPGTEPLPVSATASDKIRLYARPKTQGPIGIEGGRYAATYLRVALGLESGSGRITWAHAHAAELLGGSAYRGGFALCDAEGQVYFLDAASGAAVAAISLGRALVSCVVQTDALTAKSTDPAPSFAAQLAEALRLPGPELAPIQKVLLDELVKLDDPLVVPTLRELATSDRSSSELFTAARAALAARERRGKAP